jgi:replicative DNA helicase
MDSSAAEEAERRAVEPKVGDQLPFSPAKQDAVLGHLLMNRTFFLTCKDRIKPSWFAEGLSQRVWTAALDYYQQFQLIPRADTDLLQHNLIQRERQDLRNAVEAKIKGAMHQATLYHLKAIETELTDWLRARLYFEGVNKSAETWNRGQLVTAYDILGKAYREIQGTVFHPDTAASFKDLKALTNKVQLDIQNALTFGSTIVDKLILKNAVSGGLLPGGTTILVAPTDIGKTTTLMTIACANMKLGKSVLFIAHEGIEAQLQLKFLCCMLGETLDWFLSNLSNPDPSIQRRITRAQVILDNKLTFIHYVKAGMTVEQVMAIIRRRQEERLVTTGHGYDLLVDDYAAKLTTEEAKHGKLEKRQRDEIVYRQFIDIALEFEFHHLGAIQTNREGSKINRGFKGYEDRLLEMEDVSESMSVMNDAHCVITINRPPIAMAQEWVTYHISKSKFGSTGWAIICRSNFGCGVSHSNDLGGIWYRGSSSGSERIDQLLTAYNNQQLPATEKL